MAAAEALCWIGENDGALALLTGYLKDERPWVRLTAASHFEWLGAKARTGLPALEQASRDAEQYPAPAAGPAMRSILE
jgi:HEAT repeat protein